MLLMKTDAWTLFIIALAIRVHCIQAKCGDPSRTDINCLDVHSMQDAVSVLRKCCQSDHSYDKKKRTCVEKNVTANFDTSDFDFLSASGTGFDGVVFGMPPCTEALFDRVLPPEAIQQTSSNKEFTSEVSCIDRDAENNSPIGKLCMDARKYCGKFSCVPKCCPLTTNMQGKSCASHDSERGFNPKFYDLTDSANPKEMEDGSLEIGIIPSQCVWKKYLLKAQFFLVPNGTIFVPEKNKFYVQNEYCLEDVYMPQKKMNGIFAFICIKKEDSVAPQEITTRFVLTLVGLIISCIFLAATLLVYSLLPDLQNLHGLTLMCEVASFLLAFLCLLSIQLTFGSKDVNPVYCHLLGCTLYFALLASFTWMNIMSFDIWWTIGGVWRTHSTRGKKRLAWYSMYAWGCPMLLTLFAVGIDTFESVYTLPYVVKPDFGKDTCWFPSKVTKSNSELIYFIVPMTLSILCNIVLFVLTVRSLAKVKEEIMRAQSSIKEHSKIKLDSDRKTLVIACKLFAVMGVSWLFEGVSYFSSNSSGPWFYIPDAFNTLRGVIIFIIFVCKASVVNALAEKFGCRKKGKKGSRSTGTTKSRDTSTPPTCLASDEDVNV